MSRIIVSQQERPLHGTISVPGDKSISHRALLLAAIAQGSSKFRNWLPAGDTLAALAVVRNLGIAISVKKKSEQAWDLAVSGVGINGLRPPKGPLNCDNAGTCMRLLSGILAGQSFTSILDGSDQLRSRPMNRIIEPLSQMGASINSADGYAPLRFEPSKLRGITYEMPMASAQVKSAVLLAGLWANRETAVHQPELSRDHTERMLLAMGAPLEVDGFWVRIRMLKSSSPPSINLNPLNMDIPGDISSAAFPLVAAAIVGGSQLIVNNLGINYSRTGILDALSTMGAALDISLVEETGGEPTGTLSLRSKSLASMDIGGRMVVRTIDELPIWAVAASQAQGTSRLRNAAELRVKEIDRISLLAMELTKLGAQISEKPDGLDIKGPTTLRGADVSSHGDHRLGMALTIAGLAASGTTTVNGADCISDSFPGFVETMQMLGAELHLDQ